MPTPLSQELFDAVAALTGPATAREYLASEAHVNRRNDNDCAAPYRLYIIVSIGVGFIRVPQAVIIPAASIADCASALVAIRRYAGHFPSLSAHHSGHDRYRYVVKLNHRHPVADAIFDPDQAVWHIWLDHATPLARALPATGRSIADALYDAAPRLLLGEFDQAETRPAVHHHHRRSGAGPGHHAHRHRHDSPTSQGAQ